MDTVTQSKEKWYKTNVPLQLDLTKIIHLIASPLMAKWALKTYCLIQLIQFYARYWVLYKISWVLIFQAIECLFTHTYTSYPIQYHIIHNLYFFNRVIADCHRANQCNHFKSILHCHSKSSFSHISLNLSVITVNERQNEVTFLLLSPGEMQIWHVL